MHIPIASVSPDLYSIQRRDDGGGGSQLRQWSSFIGIVTAIVGNLLISFALNTQRYAHIRIDREHKESRRSLSNSTSNLDRSTGYGTISQDEVAEERSQTNFGRASRNASRTDESEDSALQPAFEPRAPHNGHEKDEDEEQRRESYLKSPYWWLGLVLMIIGEAGNFLAYGFAPASIVSPLGVVALISNCLIAPLMLKEHFRKRDFGGVVVAIAGAVTVVLSASSSEQKIGPGELWKTVKRWEFLLYVVVTCLLIAGLLWASPRYGRRTIFVDLGLVGLFGGYTALSTKGVASLLSTSLYKAFAFPIFYFLVIILVASALMQIRYLNRALQIYDSTQVIPTQFVLFTLSVIIGSAVLYRDFEHTGTEQAVKFISGCFLTFFGVYLITSKRSRMNDIDNEDADGDEAIQLIDEEAMEDQEQVTLKHEPDNAILPNGIGHDNEPHGLQTPQRPSTASSSAPSIAITPAAESSEGLPQQPWLSSSVPPEGTTVPRTPQISRIQAESGATPFFTPATSKVFHRTISSPADPTTPTTRATPRPPTPDAIDAAVASPEGGFLTRSARGSISRLLPGPLLPPLSSSLSALVADSILRGEGAPRSVRARIRRTRSARHHTESEQRRMTAVSDEDNPLGARSAEDLVRQRTRDTLPLPGVRDVIEEEDDGHRRTRLRALSETLSGMIGRSKGKKRDDYSDAPSRNGGQA